MGNCRCMGCMKEYDESLAACPECGFTRYQPQAESYYLDVETVLDNRYIIGRAMTADYLGISYLAWDFQDECSVIIKEYYPKDLSHRVPHDKNVNTYDGEKGKRFETGLSSFVEKASSLSQISMGLDGVAKIKNYFIENSTAYYVLEAFDGISLKTALSTAKMSWKNIIQIMEPVLQSLDVIHKNGLVLNNISPDTIIMTRDKRIKLLGIESASTVEEIKDKPIPVLSPSYSPQEHYHADGIKGPFSDVYSIAAVMYYAITGEQLPDAIERRAKDTVVPLNEIVDIPLNISNAIMNALNVERQFRTQSCGKLLEDFHSPYVNRIEEIRKKEDNGKWSKKTKGIVISALIVTIAVIAALVFVFVSKNINNVALHVDEKKYIDFTGYEEKKLESYFDKLGNADYIIVDVLEGVDADPGTVVWQSVEPNSTIEDGDVVEIKLAKDEVVKSNSSDKQVMPSVLGEGQNTALQMLANAGFTNVKTETRVNDSFRAGIVCAQSVAKDKKIDKAAEIIIYIAKSSETTTAHSTTKKPSTTKAATTTKPTTVKITEKKTTTKKTTEKTTEKIKQKKTTEATKATQAAATESTVRVPKVSGWAKKEGLNQIRAAGLNTQTESVPTNNPEQDGIIRDTSPAAGASAKKGTGITVYVYHYEGDE